jgi:alpha-L-fucosidase
MPAECDVSIRPGWFWHEKENDRVKTPAQLFDLYCRSVGHGASFLLNVPPDRRGLLHENDMAALRGFGALVKKTFAENLAAQTMTRNLEFRLKRPATVGLVRIREQIEWGQRVEAFVVEAHERGDWREVARGTSIGACRIVRLAEPIATDRVRLRITQAAAPPVLREFGVYAPVA